MIASGGAGKLEDLADALAAGAHGVLAASIFHFRGSSLAGSAGLPPVEGLSGSSMILAALSCHLRCSMPPHPCTRVSRAGTELRGDTKICPGRYRIADPAQKGVLIVAASGLHIDLDGVIIESGDSVPSRYSGYGLTLRNVDSVAITGGTIRGFRIGVLLEGGSGHTVSGMTLSGSRTQALRSTPERYSEADWLDIFHPDTFETYGAGLYLKNADGDHGAGRHGEGRAERDHAVERPAEPAARQRRLGQQRLGHQPVALVAECAAAEPGHRTTCAARARATAGAATRRRC